MLSNVIVPRMVGDRAELSIKNGEFLSFFTIKVFIIRAMGGRTLKDTTNTRRRPELPSLPKLSKANRKICIAFPDHRGGLKRSIKQMQGTLVDFANTSRYTDGMERPLVRRVFLF